MRKFLVAFICLGAFVGFLFKGFSPVPSLESENSPGAASLFSRDHSENFTAASGGKIEKVSTSSSENSNYNARNSFGSAKKIPLDRQEASKRWNAISKLVACSYGAACAYSLPEKESRDAFFAARDAILKQVEWFMSRSIPREDLPQSLKAAQGLLSFQDEQVQASALKWILSMPASHNTMKILQDDLKDTVDPDLVRLLVMELRRQMDIGNEEAAMDFSESMLFEGSIMASREFARSVGVLITDANRSRFERWATQLPKTALKTKLLWDALGSNDTSRVQADTKTTSI